MYWSKEAHVVIQVSGSVLNDWPGVNSSVTYSALAGASAPGAESSFQFLPPPPIMPPNERLGAAQPDVSAPMEIYNEPLDSNNASDDSFLFNRLLEIPGVLDMLTDTDFSMATLYEQGLDNNFNPNFNQNFNENFSGYNDRQFNMLVNENQTSQSEPQENPSGVVQVKTEETL